MSLPERLNQFATLVEIIARLRAPGGCPWDRKQTHASLRENLLAECYEVLEALDEGNSGMLCEELGDLLLQIVLHARIAAEAGEFEMGDVISSINAKLIHRHPHIFGTAKVKDAEEAALSWEVLKKEEKPALYLEQLMKLSESMKITAKCGLGQSVANSFYSIVHNFKEEMIY